MARFTQGDNVRLNYRKSKEGEITNEDWNKFLTTGSAVNDGCLLKEATPNSEQEFEEIEDDALVEASLLGAEGRPGLANLSLRIIKAHKKAVTAAEVALLEKLKEASRRMGESVGTETAFYNAVPTQLIDAELKQRGAKG